MVATATGKEGGGKKKPYVNPDKDKTCNHCKKKGHVERKCWKKNPDLIPDKVKAAQKKQAEKKSEKATAAVDNEMILILARLEFDITDAFTSVPTDKSIVYLKNIYEDDDKPPVTALKPSKDGTYDLDLSPSAVANVIADNTVYKLFGIVQHTSNATGGGHYTAITQNKTANLWHIYDDDDVKVCKFRNRSLNKALVRFQKTATILFYKREGTERQIINESIMGNTTRRLNNNNGKRTNPNTQQIIE